MMAILFFLFLFQLLLAVPVAQKTNSLGRFFIAGVVAFFGVTLPLAIFLLSSSMVPECKQDCKFGWLDCFIKGKLALIPLALWATAALYAVDVLRVKNRTRGWIVLGILFGALISDVSLIFGIVFFGIALIVSPDWVIALFLLIPLYVAVWYSIRAVQLLRASHLSSRIYVYSLFGSVPFWLTSYVWSKSTYWSLPDQAGGCFIVTAASRGHVRFTGPHTEIFRNGRCLRANKQLLTFWELETHWQRQSPRSHTAFRRIYNRLGPIIAARIKSPWLADATCLALKPLEFTARWINHKD
jgi:hypothetical protein